MTTTSTTGDGSRKADIQSRYEDWKKWQVQVPPLVILAICGLAAIKSGLTPSLWRLFADGSIILYAGFVLIGLLMQLRQLEAEQNSLTRNSAFSKMHGNVLVSTLLSFLSYGFIGADCAAGGYFEAGVIEPVTIKYGIFSIFFVVLSIILSFTWFWRAIRLYSE